MTDDTEDRVNELVDKVEEYWAYIDGRAEQVVLTTPEQFLALKRQAEREKLTPRQERVTILAFSLFIVAFLVLLSVHPGAAMAFLSGIFAGVSWLTLGKFLRED